MIWIEASDRLFAPDQRNHKKDEEEEEADFGHACRSSSDTAKAKHASNESHDDKSKGPGKHGSRVV